MNYTQEQLDAAVAEARKGLFTEDDLTRRVTSEVDRRVESGIQKGLETQRAKWEEEYKRTQNLTAEQLAAEKLREAQESLSAKEREINRKANLADAKDMLSSAQVPKAHYEKVVGMLVTENAEDTKSRVQNFIDAFLAMKSEVETQIKSDVSKVPPPDQNKTKPITKADFDKMGFSEKVAFKQSNPELYKEFIK